MDCVLCSLPKYALTSPLQGPAILKAALAAHGFSSQVLDLNQEMGRRLGDLFPNLSWEDLEPLLLMHPSYSRIRPQIQQLCKEWAQRIAALQPRSVGVSIFTDRSEWIAEDFLQSLRTHVPYAKIIIGGAHCEYVADRFVQLNLADYAIIGEGEQILPELLMGGFTDPRKVIKIPFLNDLSLVPIPDYTDLNMNRYYGLYLSASRSCPHHCRFCEVFKRFGPFRLRPVGQVMDELRTLAGKYPHLKLFYFTDSLLNGDMGYFRDLLQELSRSDLDITWEGFLTVPNEKQMTPEDFDLLSQSGAHLVKIGVESGSPEVRQHMGKKFDERALVYTLNQLGRVGVAADLLFMTGYPTESADDFQQSLDLLERLAPYSQSGVIAHIRVAPTDIVAGTPLWRQREKLGIGHDAGGEWFLGPNTRKRRAELTEIMRSHAKHFGFRIRESQDKERTAVYRHPKFDRSDTGRNLAHMTNKKTGTSGTSLS